MTDITFPGPATRSPRSAWPLVRRRSFAGMLTETQP